MALVDDAAANASLDANYGPGKAAGMPASHQVALFAGDPRFGGVEISGGGYARVTLTNDGTGWPTAAASRAKTSADVVFATSTGAWSDTATHWALISTGPVMWDCGPLSDSVTVTGPGADLLLTITVTYDDN